MTVGPLTEDERRVRASFAALRELFSRRSGPAARSRVSIRFPWACQGDFETAIEEGSTLVRIGTALFGPEGTGMSRRRRAASPCLPAAGLLCRRRFSRRSITPQPYSPG